MKQESPAFRHGECQISEYYKIELDPANVRLLDSTVPEDEWTDPGALPLSSMREGLISKWNASAFQLDEKHIHLQPESIVTTISISEKEFIPFSI